MSWYQKGKTNLDFTGARDSEWQWHQLGHMQVCTLLLTDNYASIPPLSFLQAGCRLSGPFTFQMLPLPVGFCLGSNSAFPSYQLCYQLTIIRARLVLSTCISLPANPGSSNVSRMHATSSQPIILCQLLLLIAGCLLFLRAALFFRVTRTIRSRRRRLRA